MIREGECIGKTGIKQVGKYATIDSVSTESIGWRSKYKAHRNAEKLTAKAELEGLKGASGADADFYVAPNGKVLPGSIKTGLVQI